MIWIIGESQVGVATDAPRDALAYLTLEPSRGAYAAANFMSVGLGILKPFGPRHLNQ